MILTSLRLAPNVERSWMDLQDKLFTRCGLISTRLFPPVIPLGDFSKHGDVVNAPLKLLERSRKHHPLTLRGIVTGPSLETPPDTPVSIPLDIDGFESLQAELFPGQVLRPRFVLAWEDPVVLADGERLEMTRILTSSDLPALPETQAFWLWAVRLVPGPDEEQWWVSAEWQELFYRRITVRYR